MPRRKFNINKSPKPRKTTYVRISPNAVKINGILFIALEETPENQAGVLKIYPGKGRTRQFISNTF